MGTRALGGPVLAACSGAGSAQVSACHALRKSQVLVDQLGLQGKLAGGGTQADGKHLPLYDVGNLELCLNGKPVRQQFLSATLAHYGVILGESWLTANKGVLDYTHDTLWEWDGGKLAPICFN